MFTQMITTRCGPRSARTPLDVTTLSAYLDGKGATSGSQVVKGVIYKDASGVPGSIVATTAHVTINAGAADKYINLPFTTPVRLPAGSYWFGLHSGGTNNVARYLATESAGALRTNADSYSDGAIKTFGAATNSRGSCGSGGRPGRAGGSSHRPHAAAL